MALCLQVIACLSALSCIAEGVTVRDRIDGFISQNLRSPGEGQSGADIPKANLTHVEAELEAMAARGFSNMSAYLPKPGESLKVRGAPCEADIFAKGFGHPFGLGSRAVLAANEVQIAMVFGLSITVCGGDFVQDTWTNHFQNLAGISVCSAEMCSGYIKGISASASLGNAMSKELSRVDPEALFKLKHIIFQSMYTYNSATMAAVKTILAAVPVGVGQPYVGIHVRRGDKGSEVALTPMSSYATAALEQMDMLGIRTVFVASDDPKAGSLLAEEFAAAGYPDIQLLQQHLATQGSGDRGKREYSDDDDTVHLLADIEGLRLATVFIGTQTSGLGRMVFYLRGEMSSSISLDGGWFDHFWS